MRSSFPIGEYRLDSSVARFNDLVEFSSEEYVAMGRQFHGEKNYNAPPTLFLDRSWNMKLQTRNGQICKIAPYLVMPNKQVANPVAMQTLEYCIEQLGRPAEMKTGLFVWDTTDGNVILQTSDTIEGFVIALFLASRSVRDTQRL